MTGGQRLLTHYAIAAALMSWLHWGSPSRDVERVADALTGASRANDAGSDARQHARDLAIAAWTWVIPLALVGETVLWLRRQRART